MTAARQPRDGRGHYQKHGVHTLKRAVKTLGARALPTKRTALGRALREWRTALVVDLGDPDALSTQQCVLVDLATTTKLQLDSVDAFLLSMPSLVDKRHRRLWPVVRERQGLATQLRDILRDLGLERRSRPVPDLGRYLVSCALDYDGAKVLLDHARAIVRSHPVLEQAVTVQATGLSVGLSRWTITSREHTASRGRHPTLVLYDECGWAPPPIASRIGRFRLRPPFARNAPVRPGALRLDGPARA